ncbi:hypothetical protein T492DRAFT_902273 [Pavlovales sp. CCMP2436]|nr:hypothetical protein T492DRAFT_902273 [Pavlovales sp. CCMP2436]
MELGEAAASESEAERREAAVADLNKLAALCAAEVDFTSTMEHHARREYDRRVTSSATRTPTSAAAGQAHEYNAPPPGESETLHLKLTSLAKRGGTRGGGQGTKAEEDQA